MEFSGNVLEVWAGVVMCGSVIRMFGAAALGQTIREGFQILREYPSHDGRVLRGLSVITLLDESRESRVSRQYLLTWDSKGIYMWDSSKIIKKIRFPKTQQNFISSISYISKLGGKLPRHPVN
jgi:hypothetical protein